jgi:hypothetical protein
VAKVKASKSKSQLHEVKQEKNKRNVILVVFRIVITIIFKKYFLLENILK